MGSRNNARDNDQSPVPVFEMLGAPTLLYRNAERYMPLHAEPMNMDAGSFIHVQLRLNRSYARWYWPMDYQAIRDRLPELPSGTMAHLTKTNTRKRTKRITVDENGSKGVGSKMEQQLVADQNLELQQEARAHMLGLANASSDSGCTYNGKLEVQKLTSLWRAYQQYDANCLSQAIMERVENEGITLNNPDELTVNSESAVVAASSIASMFDSERLDKAQTPYLAPFDASLVEEIAREDLGVQFPATYIPTPNLAADMEGFKLRGTHRQNLHYGNAESTDFPTTYGNCLMVKACSCASCRQSAHHHSWYLIHATGALLDKLCCSALRFPGDEATAVTTSTTTQASYLGIGDSLRQLEECGENKMVARTTIHCTIFRISVESSVSDLCPRQAKLVQLYRIDARSFTRTLPSFRPVDVVGHPKYGNSWTDSNIVILYKSSGQGCRTIKHVRAGNQCKESSHYISNLQSISKIVFGSLHPMVLWSSARSYILPALKESQTSTRHPRSGRGTSLFSIDLRCDLASFQWSPSAEDFRVEGTHSISGLFTDWKMPHSLFASSISCSKVWEIDVRMPCRSIHSWSLPSICDDTDSVVHPQGLFGNGSIFTQPKLGWADQTSYSPLRTPTLMLKQCPNVGRLHLYQRPVLGSRCQTPNLEATARLSLAALNANVALSSTYPLPDVGGDVFSCGLAAININANRLLLASPSIVEMNDGRSNHALCVMTATNKGDVYSNLLMEGVSDQIKPNKFDDDCPVGNASIHLPISLSDHADPSSKNATNSSFTMNKVDLNKHFPCPSRSILPGAAVNSPADIRVVPTASEEQQQLVKPLVCGATVLVNQSQRQGHLDVSEQSTLNLRASLRESSQAFEHANAKKRRRGEERKTDVSDELVTQALGLWPDLEEYND